MWQGLDADIMRMIPLPSNGSLQAHGQPTQSLGWF